MMKRFLALMLAAISGFSLVACSRTSSQPKAPAGESYQLASAVYPEMAPYPDESKFIKKNGEFDSDGFDKVYDAWRADRAKRQEQSEGYTESLDGYFRRMIPQLLTDANDENKACSPINIYMALAMLAEVTDGQSREQILDVLGSENLDALRKEASAVWNANYCNDGAVTSVLASSLWLNDQLEFKQDAMNALAMYYYASSFRGEMGSDDFNKALQDWINEKTGGLLSEQASGLKMDPETILALATTVYFRAKWDYEFAESNTTEDTFHSDVGDVKCNFMHASSDDTYYWSDHFSAVAKGLENSGAMWFLLPDEGITPEKLLSEDETLDFLLSGGESAESDRYIVNLSIPKFDISSDKRLLEDLKAVGISDVFNAEKADFSPMTDDSEVALTQAQHAARVAIDEEGVTAAAYTVMQVAGAAAPPDQKVDFTLDRPFVFAITGEDGLPLFVGVVHKP